MFSFSSTIYPDIFDGNNVRTIFCELFALRSWLLTLSNPFLADYAFSLATIDVQSEMMRRDEVNAWPAQLQIAEEDLQSVISHTSKSIA